MKLMSLTLNRLFIVIFILFTGEVMAQELVEDKIDEFTHNSVKRTSWEKLVYDMDLTAYFRLSKINNTEYLDLKMMDQTIFSISRGQEIMFKLINGEVLKLYNLEYTITCTGCGAIGFSGSAAQGISVSYVIDKETSKKLRTNLIEKIRIYTNKGYIEKELKPKFAQNIFNAILLLE